MQEKHAQEWVARQVRAGAASRALQQDVAKRAALQWLRTTPDPFLITSIRAQLSYISQSLESLQAMGQQPSFISNRQEAASVLHPMQTVHCDGNGALHPGETRVAAAVGIGADEQPCTSIDATMEDVHRSAGQPLAAGKTADNQPPVSTDASMEAVHQSVGQISATAATENAANEPPPASTDVAVDDVEQPAGPSSDGGAQPQQQGLTASAEEPALHAPPTSSDAAVSNAHQEKHADAQAGASAGLPASATPDQQLPLHAEINPEGGNASAAAHTALPGIPASALQNETCSDARASVGPLPRAADPADPLGTHADAPGEPSVVNLGKSEASEHTDAALQSQGAAQPMESTATVQPAAETAHLQRQSGQPNSDGNVDAALSQPPATQPDVTAAPLAATSATPQGTDAMAASGAMSGAVQNAAGGLLATPAVTLIQQQQQDLQLQQQQLMWQQWAYAMGMPHLLQQLPGLQQWGAAAPATPQAQWGVSQPQQWGGWLGTRMGTHMPPYLAAQYMQQQAWAGTQYSQALQPGLGGLGLSCPLGVWSSSQPMGAHFSQQQTSNPFAGAPAAFPQPMQQDPQGGNEEMPDVPDWQPIPYGSPTRGEPEPTAAAGAAGTNNAFVAAPHGVSFQPGTHSFATPLQTHAHLYGQAGQVGVHGIPQTLQVSGAYALTQPLQMQPIQQLQQAAAQAQLSQPAPQQLPTSAAAAAEAEAESGGLGGLRLVDYTSDDEDRSAHSPSHTEQQSQGSHRSRISMHAGQSTGSMPRDLLRRSQLGLGTLHQSSQADGLAQHAATWSAAAAAADDDGDPEDMREPAPPGVGSPAGSGQSRPLLHEGPLYRPSLQFPSPTPAAAAAPHADTAGSLQANAEQLQQPALPSGLVPEHAAQPASTEGKTGFAAGIRQEPPIKAQECSDMGGPQPVLPSSAAAASAVPQIQPQGVAGPSSGQSDQPQSTMAALAQAPAVMHPVAGTAQGQPMQSLHAPVPHLDPASEHGTAALSHQAPEHSSLPQSSLQQQQQQQPQMAEATSNNMLPPSRDSPPEAGREAGQMVIANGDGNPVAPHAAAASRVIMTGDAVRAAELQVGVLEALREMGGQHMTLALLTQTGALKAVQELRSCQVRSCASPCSVMHALTWGCIIVQAVQVSCC